MSGTFVALSLGSNRGDRRLHLRRAIAKLTRGIRIVRVSSLYQTEPVDATPGSPPFLNAVVVGVTPLGPIPLLEMLLATERELGRRRRLRNEPRIIDIDLIVYDCRLHRNDRLVLPHPRYRTRNFVLAPLRELGLNWVDPATAVRLEELRGEGRVEKIGALY